MFSLELECGPELCDLLIADLWECGCTGIEETGCGLRAFFVEDSHAAFLLERFAPYAACIRPGEERDWVEFAERVWQPMLVGTRFFLAPEWCDEPTPSGRFRININPGMAFGTGAHESTQLCLEALERYTQPGMTVLDIGTGSGILAIAASLLGAARVFACDVDPVAVEIAGRRTGIVFLGSANAIGACSVDLVVVNISPEAIAGLAPDLLRCLRPQGVAIASGFETSEAVIVRAAIASAGGVINGSASKGKWSLLVAIRNGGLGSCISGSGRGKRIARRRTRS